jgi:hypothetical protein
MPFVLSISMHTFALVATFRLSHPPKSMEYLSEAMVKTLVRTLKSVSRSASNEGPQYSEWCCWTLMGTRRDGNEPSIEKSIHGSSS